MKSAPAIAGIAAIFTVTASFIALGGARVDATVATAANFSASVITEGCTNNPGPFITIGGELKLTGIDARLIFRNNRRGTHERTEDVTVDVTLLNDKVIQFAKQPPLGGVGGNPFIFLELYDGNWNSISKKILLGRCVQGLKPVSIDFLHLAGVGMDITADCSNHPGPYITLSGELAISGLNAKLWFQNSPRPNAPHQRSEAVELKIEILGPGESITFAKQPPLGGVGGNPRIYLQFVSSEGYPLSKEYFLGRCVQLSK